MNMKSVIGFVVIALGMSTIAEGDPPSCDITFDGDINNFWHVADNWDSDTLPTDTQVACIVSGATVHVWYAASGQDRAEAVYIDSTSAVHVWGGDNLTLCAGASCVASQIDGVLDIYKLGKVIIGDDHTFNGSGLIKMGLSGNASGDPLVEGASDTTVITLASGLTLQGWGDLDLVVTNNGTVAARSGTLELQHGGDGSGKWTAETSTGRLLISGEIEGSATWELDDDAGAKIEIDATSECLTGDVEVSLGTLDVDANFRTTGELQMGGASSLVDVAGTKSAKFSMQSVPPACVGGGGGPD